MTILDYTARVTTWGFRLHGRFEPTANPENPNRTYVIACPNRHVAVSRAGWWANFRTDVAVWVCAHEDGRGWEDVELVCPDAFAEVAA